MCVTVWRLVRVFENGEDDDDGEDGDGDAVRLGLLYR